MENITDLLTNFFVSKKTKPINSSKNTLINNKEIDSHSTTQTTDQTSTQKTETTDNSTTTKTTETTNNSTTETTDTTDTTNNSTTETNETNETGDGNLSKNDKNLSVVLDDTNDNNDHLLKKMVLKSYEFYKRNIIVVNNDAHFDLETISDLLFKLTNMRNVEKIYENSLHIFIDNNNKEQFRDMLLENPDLYFNNLIIKNTLSLPKLDSNKRHIFIIDCNLIITNEMDKSYINTLRNLASYSNSNIQLILIYNRYKPILVNMSKILGNNTLIINRLNRSKILQKIFYSNIVKQFKRINNYIELINSDNLDIKYLVIKNNELRYT